MAEVINMPRLSDTMEEGTLAKWFKKVGDTVKEGEILAEIETDKATMEFESFYDGVLLHIGIDEGSTAPVDSIIAIIGSKGEDISKIINNDTPAVKEEPTPAVKEEPTPAVKEEPTPAVKEEPTPVVKEEPTPVVKEEVKADSTISISNDRILISPLAKKLANEKGIDISAIKGSGDNGRIIKRDIDSFKPSNYSQFTQPRPHLKESSYETQNSTMRKLLQKDLQILNSQPLIIILILSLKWIILFLLENNLFKLKILRFPLMILLPKLYPYLLLNILKLIQDGMMIKLFIMNMYI